MNVLDIVLLCLFIPGIIRGITKGFLEQVLALAGIFVSVRLACRFQDPVSQYLQSLLSISDPFLNVLSFVLVLLAALLLVVLLAKLITKLVEMATLGWVNRGLGVLFSVLLTAMVLGLLAIFFDSLNARFGLVNSSVLEASRLYAPLRDLGYVVFPHLKEAFTSASAAAAAATASIL